MMFCFFATRKPQILRWLYSCDVDYHNYHNDDYTEVDDYHNDAMMMVMMIRWDNGARKLQTWRWLTSSDNDYPDGDDAADTDDDGYDDAAADDNEDDDDDEKVWDNGVLPPGNWSSALSALASFSSFGVNFYFIDELDNHQDDHDDYGQEIKLLILCNHAAQLYELKFLLGNYTLHFPRFCTKMQQILVSISRTPLPPL